MEFSREEFDIASKEAQSTPENSERIWIGLQAIAGQRPSFNAEYVSYYFGALIVIGSMGWLMNKAIERLGGLAIFLIALAYAITFISVGSWVWFRTKMKTAGGILYTMAVCMTPLAVYGLERMSGLWPEGVDNHYGEFHRHINGCWLAMEAATILCGLSMLMYIRFPFITAPMAVAAWYMSMDIVPAILGRNYYYWDHEGLWISVTFGAVMLISSMFIQKRSRQDFAFWGFIFGTLAFWGGLSMMNSGVEWKKFVYFVLNLGLILSALIFKRYVLIVCGGLGVFGYLWHLADQVFKDNIAFPFVLSLVGVAVIFLGSKLRSRVIFPSCPNPANDTTSPTKAPIVIESRK